MGQSQRCATALATDHHFHRVLQYSSASRVERRRVELPLRIKRCDLDCRHGSKLCDVALFERALIRLALDLLRRGRRRAAEFFDEELLELERFQETWRLRNIETQRLFRIEADARLRGRFGRRCEQWAQLLVEIAQNFVVQEQRVVDLRESFQDGGVGG